MTVDLYDLRLSPLHCGLPLGTADPTPLISNPPSQPHTGPLCRNLRARSPQGATNVRPPRGPPTRRGPALLLGHIGGVQWCLSIGPPTKPPTDDSNCSVAEPD
ncbi:hypothetical protein ACOMHN_000484 [Nucella lapillus]